MTTPPLPVPSNPLIPGFHPDPSVCRVGDDYYLACSSFEYLPGIPVFHSRDLAEWSLIGHVADREGQLEVRDTPTLGGAWAPTLRHHDGTFYCVVTDAHGRGSLIFTAERPEGPWSDGTPMQRVSGIDPDIAWDEDGTCYVTYSGLLLHDGDAPPVHLGIQQVRMDPERGLALEEPRSLWSGTGLMFPEAPHIYQIDGTWYLLIAEGGTERGHAVSIARSDRPDGPFEGCPANPVLSARSTDRPVQNTGHADLVQRPDGSWFMVMLGMRTRGTTRAFSPMGRETFVTGWHWEDGWPVVAPVELAPPGPGVRERDDFDDAGLDPRWLGVRRFPSSIASLSERPGWLRLHAGDAKAGMDDLLPAFVGQRQRHERATFTVLVDVSEGTGGISMRIDEQHHYDIEVGDGVVRARARVGSLTQTWEQPHPDDVAVLRISTEKPPADGLENLAPDMVRLSVRTSADAEADEVWTALTLLDGRYVSAETTASFTGRAVGIYAVEGTVDADWFVYEGRDAER